MDQFGLTFGPFFFIMNDEPLAHSVEHRPFKASVLGSKPRRLTKSTNDLRAFLPAIFRTHSPDCAKFVLASRLTASIPVRRLSTL